jgi:uncharacterized protein (DUF1697 family)
MLAYVALLRAVNIGSHKKVAMADLRDLVAQLGFNDPRTLLNSGNLVFRAAARQTKHLERLLEIEANKRLGLSTEFFVRNADEWEAIIAGNPFPDEAKRDPGHLVVHCLKEPPPAANVRALRSAIIGRETIQAGHRHLYMVYPDGIGRSKLTNAFIERKLGAAGTGRNWNTVLKLAARLSD